MDYTHVKSEISRDQRAFITEVGSEITKAIRRHQGLSIAEVASSLGLLAGAFVGTIQAEHRGMAIDLIKANIDLAIAEAKDD